MWIKKLIIKNFRNYINEEINLKKEINTFFGENAQGKTNILEAIYVSALGKSFRTKKDKELINYNSSNCSIEVFYEKADRNGKIKIILDDKKLIYLNDIKIKRLSELVSNLNIVIFTPEDINILKGSPQNRRKFLNIMIGQLRPNYLFLLNKYLKILEQRNACIRQIKEYGKNEDLLEIWDEKLSEEGVKIYNYRKEFIEKIEKYLKKEHEEITKSNENIEIKYLSECKEKKEFLEMLYNRRKIDIKKGYTAKGVHRDDFVIYINGKPVNIYGSQGQNRTVMLSLKLSEINIIKDEIDEYPVLLLDDFMSELDNNRINNFLEKIKDIQVIITSTQKLSVENSKNLIYNVKDGHVYKNY